MKGHKEKDTIPSQDPTVVGPFMVIVGSIELLGACKTKDPVEAAILPGAANITLSLMTTGDNTRMVEVPSFVTTKFLAEFQTHEAAGSNKSRVVGANTEEQRNGTFND